MGLFREVLLQAATTVVDSVELIVTVDPAVAGNGGLYTSAAALYVVTTAEVNTASLVVTVENNVLGSFIEVGEPAAIITNTASGYLFGSNATATGDYLASFEPPLSPSFRIRQNVTGATASIDVKLILQWLPTSVTSA